MARQAITDWRKYVKVVAAAVVLVIVVAVVVVVVVVVVVLVVVVVVVVVVVDGELRWDGMIDGSGSRSMMMMRQMLGPSVDFWPKSFILLKW